MAYLSKSDMRARGVRHIDYQKRRLAKSERRIVSEATTFDSAKTYDIFLSHSTRDRALVLGVKERLEEEGLAVYVDWIDDTDMDRAAVTPENAARLRVRMTNCRALLYLATDNATRSKWMPWEVGYFDGLGRGTIGILPVLDDPNEGFEGMEFLGLYPAVDARKSTDGLVRLFAELPDGGVRSIRNLAQHAVL
jgi:hypothetical protein